MPGLSLGGALLSSHVPWAFSRGDFIQPQHSPRVLAPAGALLPLRAGPSGVTDANDATVAPSDQNVAYDLDFSGIIPFGLTISGLAVSAVTRPSSSVDWSAATDVTSTFLGTAQASAQAVHVITCASGTQTLAAQYRVRVLLTLAGSLGSKIEGYFDLTCA